MKRKKVLIIFPSNAGDIILCLPALSLVAANFAAYDFSALSSPSAERFVKSFPLFREVFIYRKKSSLRQKIGLWRRFLGQFEVIADFKNTAYSYLCFPKKRTSFIRLRPEKKHKKDYYLDIAGKICQGLNPDTLVYPRISLQRRQYFTSLLGRDKYIFVCPFSRSRIKSFPEHKLVEVLTGLKESFKSVLIGGPDDGISSADITINLAGQTNLEDLFYLFKYYGLAVLAVDSAPLHIASYVNARIVAVFGPTSPELYGPFSRENIVLTNNIACVPCQAGSCRLGENKCLTQIPAQEVIKAVKEICS